MRITCLTVLSSYKRRLDHTWSPPLKRDLPCRSTRAIRSDTPLVIQRSRSRSVNLSRNRSSLVGDSLAVELPALTRTALVRIQVPQPERRTLPALGGCQRSASLCASCFWKPDLCSIDLLFSQLILNYAPFLRRIVRRACKRPHNSRNGRSRGPERMRKAVGGFRTETTRPSSAFNLFAQPQSNQRKT